MKRILLSPPHVGLVERQLLLEAFDSNWIAPLGPHVDAFERELAEKVGVPYAVALSSGTAALHLSLSLIGVKAGDEVLTSSLTFAATANAIRYRGAAPVFIDSDVETWQMNPELLREELAACAARDALPRAVLVVDLYGQCADYDRIVAICDEYGVPLIEDAAEALGSTYKGRSAGSFGSLAAFSFNGNKIITTSGGGMLVSANRDLVEHARKLSTQAREPVPHYEHLEIGFNYRMSNLLAALGRAQLESLPERIATRRRIRDRYRELLDGTPGISFMPEAAYGKGNAWLTCILVDPEAYGADREQVRLALEAEDIEARPLWKPMHLQPIYATQPTFGGDVSARLFEHGLCLPSGSALTDTDQDRVAATVLACRRAGVPG
jgi:dTDP-4-amino-4,6-dideoxygalactose transaminase